MNNQTETLDYGDATADEGTPAWAKRTHIVLLSSVDGAKFKVHDVYCYFISFLRHESWRMLPRGDRKGKFTRFAEYVTTPKPFGLGMDYDKFRAMMVSEMGEREYDRLVVDSSVQGERTDLTSSQHEKKSSGGNTARLRAINRAPAAVQQLYDRELLAVDVAAKFGPTEPGKQDEMGRKAEVLQRHALEVAKADLTPREKKLRVTAKARDLLGQSEPTPLEQIRRLLPRLTPQERDQLRPEI